MLILFQKKTLCILVGHYYKYNLFKDKNDDISYYPQLLLQQCACKRFINKVLYHPDLELNTHPEPESKSESEEEINESTVLDE